jgi:hypothetical protein
MNEENMIANSEETLPADFIVTRNIGDFTHSIISAILPEDFLLKLEATHE